jgi:hypothetical protein
LKEFIPQALKKLNQGGLMYVLLISDNLPFLKWLDAEGVKWEVLIKREVTGEK